MRKRYGRLPRLAIFLGILTGWSLMIQEARGQESGGDAILARFETMVEANLDNPRVLPSSLIDSLMLSIQGKPVGERIAFWAETLYRDGRARYHFGLDPGGYVAEGRLCDDTRTDCVLFFYRTTELGRSSSAREAVQFAFGTRFYGASVEETILPDGRVRYEDDSHLDYAEEILRTGIWGQDVTATVGPVETDPGNERFASGTLSFVPTEKINFSALRSGDLVYFILDGDHPEGAKGRAEGTLIQHLGVLSVSGGEVDLIHAAKGPIPGVYEGGKIERIGLKAYLDAVDKFKGILVTRIEEF